MEHEQDGLHPGCDPQLPTNQNTAGRDFAILALIMAVLLVVFCVSLFKYDQSHNVGTQAYRKLQKQNDTTAGQNKALNAQNGMLTTTNATLSAKNTELQNEKAQFCTELGKVKINDPLCTK